MSRGRNDPRRRDGVALPTGPCPTPEKHRFASKARAKLSLRRTSAENRDAMHAYRCRCGVFHIGHKPGSRKNRNPQPREAA